MALSNGDRTAEGTIRTLTKQEIDRRIDDLVKEVALPREVDACAPAETAQPRWIAPAELVRRLRRFMVYN